MVTSRHTSTTRSKAVHGSATSTNSTVSTVLLISYLNVFFLCFPVVGVRLVTRHFAVRLFLLFSSIAPGCWPFLSMFLPPLPFLCLSSHNPPILAVVFFIFCNLLVSLSQFFSVMCPAHFIRILTVLPTGLGSFSFSPISLHRQFSLSNSHISAVFMVSFILSLHTSFVEFDHLKQACFRTLS